MILVRCGCPYAVYFGMVFSIADNEYDFIAYVNSETAEEGFDHVLERFEVFEHKIEGYIFFKGHKRVFENNIKCAVADD